MPQPLDYETPSDDVPAADPRWAMGAAAGVLAVGPVAWVLALLFDDPNAHIAPFSTGVLAGGAAAVAGLIAGGVLMVIARTAHARGIGLGLIAGGGLIFLIVGGCSALA